VFFSKPTELSVLDGSDEPVVATFLDPRIFPHIRSDCKIFRIKKRDDEFIFTKRRDVWVLDNPASNLEVRNDLVAKFFREIFSMEGGQISVAHGRANSSDVAVTLYGKNFSERVNFFTGDGGESLAENDAADLFFTIERKKIVGLMDAIDNLLKFRIFPLQGCDDIRVVSAGNGERFNFHNLNSQGKWQLTYAKNGELKVKEIDGASVSSILDLMKNAESVSILSELPVENKEFTIVLNDGTDERQIFNFYGDGDRSFVEPDGQSVKFEVDSRFPAALLEKIRANVPGSEEEPQPAGD
jgi:hypothetical protein